MAPSFPLSRAALPSVAGSARERSAARRAMMCMLEHAVAQFDAQMVDRQGEADAAVWRPVSSPAEDAVRVFREREEGESSRSLARALNAALTQSGGADLSEREAHHLRSSYLAALTAPAVMATSCAAGKVENAMFAVLAPTQEDTALVASFMTDDVVDCAVLRSIDEQQGQNASSFLGYKYVVRSATTAGVATVGRKYHDQCYLEFCGYTQSPASGEKLGFHLVHSVDLLEFPDLSAFHSSRAPPHSARYLFRQKSDKTVEVFMQGNVIELATVMVPVWGLKRLLSCAEAKRLTQMVSRRRDSVEVLGQSTRRTNECYLCRRSKRFFGGAMLSECDVCRQLVCTKCRNDKKIFVGDVHSSHGRGGESSAGIGRFERVTTCKTCVLVASAGCAPPPMHMLISEQMRAAQATRGRSGSSSAGSRSSASVSGRGSQSERSTASNTSASASEDDARSFTPSSVISTLRREQQMRNNVQRAPVHRSVSRTAETINESAGAMNTSSRGQENRMPSSQSSIAVAMGYTVPLKAPVSIAKARVRQQQQQQQPPSLRTSTIHHGAVNVVKPNIPTKPPAQTFPVHRGNCRPSRQDSLLVAYDVHGLRRTASTASSTSSAGSFSSSRSRPSTTSFSSERESSLYARMLELSKVVESTYNTTQQNGAFIAQQARREAHRAI